MQLIPKVLCAPVDLAKLLPNLLADLVVLPLIARHGSRIGVPNGQHDQYACRTVGGGVVRLELLWGRFEIGEYGS